MASALLTAMSPNRPNVGAKLEAPNSKLLPFAFFPMRGFGKFDHSLGVSAYSGHLEDALIRASNSRRELMLSLGWRFPMSERLARGAKKLTMGAYSPHDVTESSILLSDFHRHSVGVSGVMSPHHG